MKTAVQLGLGVWMGMAVGGSPLSAKDWPQWRGPERNGKSSETGILKDWEAKPPKLLWTAEGTGEGYSSLAVVGDRIYTTGNLPEGQGVVAIDAKEGKVLWSKVLTEKAPKHGYEGARCTPTVDGDHLYVTTSNGTIACLTTGGNLEWQKDFKQEWGGKMMSGWGYAESVLIDGKAAVCTPGGPEAMMVALDKATGKELWKCKVPDIGGKGKDGAGYASIMISQAAGVKQYVQMTGRGLIGVRASDGKFLWGYNEIANNTANIPDAVIAGEHVFCSTGYGTGAALVKLEKDGDGVKAQEVYFLKANVMQNHHGGMVLLDGHIYCGHQQNGGDPVCVDVKTGKVVWGPEKGVGKGSACVTYADGHLIYRYQSGELGLVEATPKGYRFKGSFKPAYQERESWSHPVVSGGKLYLREQNKLMCYGL